ncbi:MAG: hypothetical protein ACKO7U_02075 [Actinomycetota bacterium]
MEWAVVQSGRRLVVAVVASAVVALLAISPLGASVSERWDLAHYTAHAAIFIPAAVIAFAIRDGLRSKPLHPYVAVALGVVALLLDLVSLVPPFDTAIETNEALHSAQHGLVALAGALVGVAVRDVIAAGRRPRVGSSSSGA